MTKTRPQQITRVPPYRPGMWVRLKHFDPQPGPESLSGRVLQVRSLTCSITRPDQQYAVWRVHFEDGRCVEAQHVEREATEAERQYQSSRRPPPVPEITVGIATSRLRWDAKAKAASRGWRGAG
jgi:hypothetical protein